MSHDYFFNKPESQTQEEFLAERQEAIDALIDLISKRCGVSYVNQKINVRLPPRPGKQWGHALTLVVTDIETETQIEERINTAQAQEERQHKLDELVDKALKGTKNFYGMQSERYRVEHGYLPK